MSKRIWAYMLQLGIRMSQDEFVDKSCKYDYMDKFEWRDDIRTDKKIWTEIVDFLPSQGINTLIIDVCEGLKYKSHPEIAVSNSWSREELREELARIRSLGIEPIPKLNFSTTHNMWLGKYRQLAGTEEYRKICNDLIDELCEVFDHPRLFHLGMDEEFYVKGYGLNIVRGPELFWRDYHSHFEACERNGARPWIWADYFWKEPELFVENVPKSVMISNWFYDPMQVKDKKTGKYPQRPYQSYVDLHEQGYDQIPTCSTWHGEENADHTIRLFMRENMVDDNLKGFLTVPWRRCYPWEIYSLKNDALRLGLAKQMYFPDEK